MLLILFIPLNLDCVFFLIRHSAAFSELWTQLNTSRLPSKCSPTDFNYMSGCTEDAMIDLSYGVRGSLDQRHFSWITYVIIWLAPRAGKMNQIARCDWLPERARWSHLARSGLPAVSRMKNFPESHIINPLLTKFVGSRWLDIGLVLFLRAYGPRLRLGP